VSANRLFGTEQPSYQPKLWSSAAAVKEVLGDLKRYLDIESCSHSDWEHDFGFGVVYCARGDQPRKSELLLDKWESDRVMIAYFSAK
jgi:hypothetical protein